jgi:predicted nucleotidyltransferase
MAAERNQVIESHYLHTVEGLFFAVKGLVHPPDRFAACLRYAPDPDGERQSQGVRYRRLYHFPEQEALLRDRYPDYLAFDPMCGVTLQSVPRGCVARVYDPRVRLDELRGQSSRDPLAGDAVAFATLLERAAGIAPHAVGISGSLLIGLHTTASDLDVTVYGKETGWAVQRSLRRILDAGDHPELSRLAAQGVRALYAERVADTRMGFDDFVASERHKVNQGVFRSRPYFLRFVPAPDEIAEQYGDYRYSPAGRAELLATVSEASESLFTPCRYAVDEIHFPGGQGPAAVREIVSFRGRFCEQAEAGDRVLARGMLERVEPRDGRAAWHRLLLGNEVEDIMIVRRNT